MKDTLTYLFKYKDAKTNLPIYPMTLEVDRIDMVLKMNLYTLTVSKVIKQGYQDKDGYQYIIKTYYLESEKV